MREPLPIDEALPEIESHLRRAPTLVIEAPPGAGKTTRVPPALLSLDPGEVLVLEPRRLAARMGARRLAAELGEPLGATIGYQVRFESVGGNDTRLRFLTEGVLTRRLISDPQLKGVGTVILDEFHERHLEGDLAAALLRRLRRRERPGLRIVAMSATLDTAPVAAFLGGCRVIRSEGRLYPLTVSYTPHSASPLEEQVARAFTMIAGDGLDGDVLVFLPGAAEIRKAARACEGIARRAGADIRPLHGDLPPDEQDRAIEPSSRPKLILSTNVAESSITIEGVTAVIDSGLARVAAASPWTGLPSLQLARISRASADQRAGRAGRVRPGRVIRLYPEADYVRRPAHHQPEILRRELAQLCLALRVSGASSADDLDWVDRPPKESVRAAEALLARLGAIDAAGAVTAAGREMARLPLHPRLARLVLAANRRGVGGDGCDLAALLSAGERVGPGPSGNVGPSDLLVLLEGRWSVRTKRLAGQIRRAARVRGHHRAGDEELLISVLEAFPDRVARRRTGDQLLLASGGGARLAPSSVVRRENLMVAVDIEERREHGIPLVRLASAVKPEWLFDLFPDQITDCSAVEWNRTAERVEAVSALLFGNIAIEESRGGQVDAEAAARLLAEKAWESGIGRFTDRDQLDAFLRRVAFAADYSNLPPLSDADVRAALEQLACGLKSFKELAKAAGRGHLLSALRSRLSRKQLQELDEIAPEHIRLPGRRRAPVHYETGRPPWIASRMQDFFGLRQTPAVARGRVPLMLHLLAPNMRPVQTTTDLAGFWKRLYPQVRRELKRRYPAHSWPENPLS